MAIRFAQCASRRLVDHVANVMTVSECSRSGSNPSCDLRSSALRAEVNADPMVCEVLNAIAIQQGPGEVLVAAKVRVENSLDARGLVTVINDLEARFKSRCREVRWLFIEPDHTD